MKIKLSEQSKEMLTRYISNLLYDQSERITNSFERKGVPDPLVCQNIALTIVSEIAKALASMTVDGGKE